jgi:hypothetical protein
VRRTVLSAILLSFLFQTEIFAIESGVYRILSVSDSTKIILIAQLAPSAPTESSPQKGQPANQTIKYVLDASTAKITVNGKAAEFKDLKNYSTAQVIFELKKFTKLDIEIDGKATEIKISIPEPK